MPSLASVALPDVLLDDIARRFRLLGDPSRLRVLNLLRAGEMSVNDITRALQAGQSNISRHLQALHAAGMVSRRRDGTTVYYRIADPVLFKLCDLVCQTTRGVLERKLAALPQSGYARTAPRRAKARVSIEV
ncbi:MAG: winged helix-turn-helix transcriptional regulator [Acidobacteria bacterium]|nr:winged helix-turn-helix transcriptional regulator [Acidobacteriota bacterium]